ncbi:MAG: methionine biosynthesis protein MetW [Magnetococcales bacterium]|nr:methionine biosynthesis protein MetW [Magnetococcales bacterium]
MHDLRVDLEIIANLVAENARVLDLGCGDGALLDYLIHTKKVRGFGVEISHEGVHACISRGVPVYHGDIDQGLLDHLDDSFDYVILSHTLQTIQKPRFVLQEMLRVGKKVIVSFPNFGHWRVRMQLVLHGRMPMTHHLPYHWYDTPNIHPCTVADFLTLCQELPVQVLEQIPLGSTGHRPDGQIKAWLAGKLSYPAANLLAPMVVFLLGKG